MQKQNKAKIMNTLYGGVDKKVLLILLITLFITSLLTAYGQFLVVRAPWLFIYFIFSALNLVPHIHFIINEWPKDGKQNINENYFVIYSREFS